ncbi:hypothetical protein AB0J86_13350 [Micromonospora sp. NPDC049559]|uniref:uridine kinase family protein n=1 Tax=Micromonospora sp. NPDC049559 TaxID=3155923 RepID=UPI003442E283
MIEAYDDLARRVLAGPARLGRTRLVAVDGPSGAGKTIFAERLAAAIGSAAAIGGSGSAAGSDGAVGPEGTAGSAAATGPGGAAGVPGAGRPPVVHTDDLLDGWADQVSFWPRLREWVLDPLRAGEPGRYRRYDWTKGEFGADWSVVPPAPVVILEGVTAARAEIRPELTCAIFVTAPSRLRLERALARDGADLLPYLRRWRRGERVHFAADRTEAHADLVVDGAATPPGAATHYVRRLRRVRPDPPT